MSSIFHIKSEFEPKGDQPRAIDSIVEAFDQGEKHHVLVGVSGSGKTFWPARVKLVQVLCYKTGPSRKEQHLSLV